MISAKTEAYEQFENDNVWSVCYHPRFGCYVNPGWYDRDGDPAMETFDTIEEAEAAYIKMQATENESAAVVLRRFLLDTPARRINNLAAAIAIAGWYQARRNRRLSRHVGREVEVSDYPPVDFGAMMWELRRIPYAILNNG